MPGDAGEMTVAEAADLETAEDILSTAYAPMRIRARGPRRAGCGLSRRRSARSSSTT